MLKIENVVTPSANQWRSVIMGARNPMNSWDRSDSDFNFLSPDGDPAIGENDQKLMMNLRNAGTDHRKFMRMIVVYVDITAPLYWWKEFDTYKVGTVANSCSTMHKIAAKEFTLEDFSCEHLIAGAIGVLLQTIDELNYWRRIYVNGGSICTTMGGSSEEVSPKDKRVWWQMIQLLPSSYNQRRTVMLNYEVLANIYKSRRNHKLDEWRDLCAWIEGLPYSGLITGSESKRFVEIAQVFQKSFQEGLEEGLNENKELVFKIPKDQISPEALELLEKGFAVDMSIGFKE